MFNFSDRNSGYLFSSNDLRQVIDQRISSLRSEVEQFDANRLLNTAPADLARYFAEKYAIDPPSLERDAWSLTEHEIRIDVRHDRNRVIDETSMAVLIPGQRIVIEVPLKGDVELMYARPSTFSSAHPCAQIQNTSLFLDYEIPHDDKARDIKKEADRTLGEIERYLVWVRNDLSQYNTELPGKADSLISARRERILSNQSRVAALGIPLKARVGAPRTFASPNVRRKVVPKLPLATSSPYVPEPVLDMENYEHILTVVQNMAQVMERSPSAFRAMGEEALRQHFLVQLNGQFEGGATGETFNVGGKTDILLRANGRNVFIAECKFWKGPKHYRETIDQLLSYTAWRDTKTSILVFNRNTAVSTVLESVIAETTIHKNFKRKVEWEHESGSRYILHHNGDTNREITLTVLIFDVPGGAA